MIHGNFVVVGRGQGLSAVSAVTIAGGEPDSDRRVADETIAQNETGRDRRSLSAATGSWIEFYGIISVTSTPAGALKTKRSASIFSLTLISVYVIVVIGLPSGV